jgi:hypothetical protein
MMRDHDPCPGACIRCAKLVQDTQATGPWMHQGHMVADDHCNQSHPNQNSPTAGCQINHQMMRCCSPATQGAIQGTLSQGAQAGGSCCLVTMTSSQRCFHCLPGLWCRSAVTRLARWGLLLNLGWWLVLPNSADTPHPACMHAATGP